MTDADLAAAYLATTWSVRAPGGTRRLAPVRAPPAGLPPGSVVTAYNPASRLVSVDENRAALRRLRDRLRASGTSFLPARAHGTGPRAREWDEPGFAIVGSDALQHALALAAEHGQNAVAWFDGSMMRIVVARAGFLGLETGAELRG